MANEKRLIDADAFREKLQEHHDFFVDGVGGFRYLTPKDKARVDEITNCIAEIVNAPTVDAVEVVRCKYCQNGRPIDKTRCPEKYFKDDCVVCECEDVVGDEPMIYPPTHFCSYGKRREV